jgi:hypothetical protein
VPLTLDRPGGWVRPDAIAEMAIGRGMRPSPISLPTVDPCSISPLTLEVSPRYGRLMFAGRISGEHANRGEHEREVGVRRLALLVGVAGALTTGAATTAAASPPQQPPGCSVVLSTPAAMTGSPQGQAEKAAAYDHVCLGP